MQKLDTKALGLALGILWALSVLAFGIINMFSTWGSVWVNALANVYIGFAPTVPGIFIGAVWGFFDALIGGIVLAWLYNTLMKKG